MTIGQEHLRGVVKKIGMKTMSGGVPRLLRLRQFLLAAAALLSWIAEAHGATIVARSVSRADVGAAVNQAVDGDTVEVPEGIVQWTNTLTISKAITVRGAGIGNTIILDGIIGSSRTEAIFALVTVPNKSYRLSGFEFRTGARTAKYFNGVVQLFGASKMVRVDNCRFEIEHNRGMYIWEQVCGVIDNCIFDMTDNQAMVIFHNTWDNQSWGDGSFSTPVDWGGTNSMYIEACTFTKEPNGAVIDSFAGARYVLRHNSFINSFAASHGTESTQRYRGMRAIEVYMNTFQDDSNLARPIDFRSGTGVLWSNIVSGYASFATLVNYRSTDAYAPWGAADGQNAWDLNQPGIAGSGTHRGTNATTILRVPGAGWTADQWKGHTFLNTTTLKAGLCFSNSSEFAFFVNPVIGSNRLLFSDGESFQIRKVRHALDMPGMGQSNLLPATAGWPNQQVEPIYEWGNRLNGGDGDISTAYHVMRAGEHFFNDTVKPNYVPLVYPHPLANRPTKVTGVRIVANQ